MRGKSFKLHQSIFDGNTDHQPRQVLFFISDPWAPETEFQLAGSHFTPRCENTSWSLTDCSLLLLCLLAAPDQRRVLLLPPSSSLWVTSNSGTHRTAVTRRPHWNPIFFPAELTAHVRKLPAWSRWWAAEQKHFSPLFSSTQDGKHKPAIIHLYTVSTPLCANSPALSTDTCRSQEIGRKCDCRSITRWTLPVSASHRPLLWWTATSGEVS